MQNSGFKVKFRLIWNFAGTSAVCDVRSLTLEGVQWGWGGGLDRPLSLCFLVSSALSDFKDKIPTCVPSLELPALVFVTVFKSGNLSEVAANQVAPSLLSHHQARPCGGLTGISKYLTVRCNVQQRLKTGPAHLALNSSSPPLLHASLLKGVK